MIFEIDAAAGDVTIAVQNELYPNEAIEGAAHAFSERLDVYVEEEDGETVLTLEPKGGSPDESALAALAGDFLNELLAQTLGKRQLADNSKLTQYIVTKALISAQRDAADPLQPPAAEESQLTDEQKKEASDLLAKAEADFAAMQKELG
jgi:His-Xaa-Ser system protein HxsD